MNNDNEFGFLIAVVFTKSPQLEVLGTKSPDLVISFCLCEGEALPKFHHRALQIRSEVFLLQDKIGQIKKLTGKYIMELSKLKHHQQFITTFELDYRKCDRLPRRQQLFNIFNSTTE